MQKKFFITSCAILLWLGMVMPPVVSAATTTEYKNRTAKEMAGRLVWQKSGRLWYVNPAGTARYAVRNTEDLVWLAQHVGHAIDQTTMNYLSKVPGKKGGPKTTAKYKGSIVYPEGKPEWAWYVNPVNGIRYSFQDINKVSATAKTIGLKASNESISKVLMNNQQVAFDPFFWDVAYTRYDGENFMGGKYEDKILPIASLTKLMTALVFLDTKPDWSAMVKITPSQIKYPREMIPEGGTSEVSLKAGDTISLYDVWVAMLLASSNQSAVVLADNSGMSRKEFVQKMNDKAASLGLTKTKFYDMTGLDANNVSTAQEMSKLAYAAFAQPKIVEAASLVSYNFSVGIADGTTRTVPVTNRNYSLLAFGPEASKTGFLTEAQRTVVLKKDGAIITVLHALSMPQRNEKITALLTAS